MHIYKTERRPRLNDGGGYRAVRGSREHPNFNHRQRKPWIDATRRYVLTLLRKKDRDTLLMQNEADILFECRIERRAQTQRRGTPLQRADCILFNVWKQLPTRKHWPYTGKRMSPATLILCHALAVELMLKYSGLRPTSRPRYRWVNVARSVHHLLRSDVKFYEQDTGRGYIRTVKVKHRINLQSWNVCKRLTERLEPIYRFFEREHGRTIALKVKAHHQGL